MKRRSFLKSAGAALLAPSIPIPALNIGAASAAVPRSTYIWAETIARAHRQCSMSMLQRHLKLDAQAIQVVKSQLIRNGVISSQANAYGVHKAINPLFDGAFIRPTKKRLAQRALQESGSKPNRPDAEGVERTGQDDLGRLAGTEWHGTDQYQSLLVA